MADFLELQDSVIINLDAVVKIYPAYGSYRVDFANGHHHTLSEADGEAIRAALRGKGTTTKPPKKKASLKTQ